MLLLLKTPLGQIVIVQYQYPDAQHNTLLVFLGTTIVGVQNLNPPANPSHPNS